MTAAKGKTWSANTVGRRKTSVARIYVAEAGSGKITINKRDIKDYFPKATNRYVVNQPLNLLKIADKFDIKVNVSGGGTTGQAGAIRHAIARAILAVDPTTRAELKKKAGFLTRDPRKVERQKPGLAGARKRFQFSKR